MLTATHYHERRPCGPTPAASIALFFTSTGESTFIGFPQPSEIRPNPIAHRTSVMAAQHTANGAGSHLRVRVTAARRMRPFF